MMRHVEVAQCSSSALTMLAKAKQHQEFAKRKRGGHKGAKGTGKGAGEGPACFLCVWKGTCHCYTVNSWLPAICIRLEREHGPARSKRPARCIDDKKSAECHAKPWICSSETMKNALVAHILAARKAGWRSGQKQRQLQRSCPNWCLDMG